MATIEGIIGRIRWGATLAGALEGYRLTYRKGPPATWTLEGRLVAFDRFKLTQRPLVFEAPHARGAWRWPIDAIDLAGDRMIARLGALEKDP